MPSNSWRQAQEHVATFFKQHHFATREEVRLPSGKRIDIVALKKFPNHFLHVLIEVKDWQQVSRLQESQFCKQVIQYLIEYSLTDLFRRPQLKDKWHRLNAPFHDRFLGILCLTKNAHFSYRKVSEHFLQKNEEIQGIPLREQIVEHITFYVARFDFLPKIFTELHIPLYTERSLSDWLE